MGRWGRTCTFSVSSVAEHHFSRISGISRFEIRAPWLVTRDSWLGWGVFRRLYVLILCVFVALCEVYLRRGWTRGLKTHPTLSGIDEG